MKWLKHLFGRSKLAETHVEADIQFLGEQDGEPERGMKTRWTPILARRASVQRAYLAIVSFDRAVTYNPALCIRSSGGEDPILIDKLAAAFKQVFAGGQMLDIMFVSTEQEDRLRRVCRPFYEKS